MYLKRLQLGNYGPLRDLDISFPFDGPRPKPVLLVGENGSGKTIALSHIVNAMVQAKDAVYPESRELDPGKVFKLRSNSYVSVGAEYYYARSDFESELFVRELRLKKPKHTYAEPPMGIDGRGLDAWNAIPDREEIDHFEDNFRETSKTNILEPSAKRTAKKHSFGTLSALFPIEPGRGTGLAKPSESTCQTAVYGRNSPQRRDSTSTNRPFTTSRHPRLAVRRCI